MSELKQGQQAAFITGSSRGIGFAAAQALAQKGFNIALNAREQNSELTEAKEKIEATGVKVVSIPGDISDISFHSNLFNQAEESIGCLSTLVNNAGVGVMQRGDILDVTEESYDRCMNVNCKAVFFLTQLFAKRIIASKCHDACIYSVINITSSNAQAASILRGEYCVSKAAASMASKVFSVRLGQNGIVVYDVQPGLIKTDMTKPVVAEYERRIKKEGLTVLPRIGQPEEIGRIVAMLATGGMPYTTGQVISADAGMLIPRF